MPGTGNPQAFNRYMYALGNPVFFTDPTGHASCTGACDEGNWTGTGTIDWQAYLRTKFGVTFKNWDQAMLKKYVVGFVAAVSAIGEKISRVIGGTASEAFRATYNSVTFEYCDACVNGLGWAKEDHLILFDGGYNNPQTQKRLVIHELGHVFDRLVCAGSSGGSCQNIWGPGTARDDLSGKGGACDGPNCLGRIGHVGPEEGQYWGFAGGWESWQFGADDGVGEVWADMFLGWTSATFDGRSRGGHRQSYMDSRMSFYLTTSFTVTSGAHRR